MPIGNPTEAAVPTKLKATRTALRLTQLVLGYHSHVSPPDISKFENRRAVPGPGQATRIAKQLGLLPSELLEPATTRFMRQWAKRTDHGAQQTVTAGSSMATLSSLTEPGSHVDDIAQPRIVVAAGSQLPTPEKGCQ